MRAAKVTFVALAYFLLSARAAPDHPEEILTLILGLNSGQTTLLAQQDRQSTQIRELQDEVKSLKRDVCRLEIAAPASAMTSMGACV